MSRSASCTPEITGEPTSASRSCDSTPGVSTPQMLANVHQFDGNAVNNDAYKTQFAQLTGS